MPKLTEQLAAPLRQMQVRSRPGMIPPPGNGALADTCFHGTPQECAKRIAKVSADAKLEVDEDTYLSSFKPHLMDVVYAWANGGTFAQICKMTDVFEGNVAYAVCMSRSQRAGILTVVCCRFVLAFVSCFWWVVVVVVSSTGSIIRCMRRLEEVLRQMCSAAKAIGNTELENKFAEGKSVFFVFFCVCVYIFKLTNCFHKT